MQYFARFFENIQQDLKAFVYWCLVFTVFRVAFIWIYSGQLNGNYADVPMALFLGARLSLKTAGIICLVGFVLASLPNIIIKIVPLSGSHVVWRIEKNTNAVRSYNFSLTSLKTSTASSTTKKTSSSSKQSGSNPFDFIRVTPR